MCDQRVHANGRMDGQSETKERGGGKALKSTQGSSDRRIFTSRLTANASYECKAGEDEKKWTQNVGRVLFGG